MFWGKRRYMSHLIVITIRDEIDLKREEIKWARASKQWKILFNWFSFFFFFFQQFLFFFFLDQFMRSFDQVCESFEVKAEVTNPKTTSFVYKIYFFVKQKHRQLNLLFHDCKKTLITNCFWKYYFWICILFPSKMNIAEGVFLNASFYHNM